MSNQPIKKVKRLIRPLINVLIVIMIYLNIYAMLDTIAKNKEVRLVNAKLEKQIEQEEEVYQQNVKDSKRIDDMINRLNLQLDRLDSQ